MEIKEIRALTGLSQSKFAEYYHIPCATLQKWEAPDESVNHRNCPCYLLELLERVVKEDFNQENR